MTTHTQQTNAGGTRTNANNNNNRNNNRCNTRNNNLAALDTAARSFKGKIEELPIIGKQYEKKGVPFKIL